RPPSRSSSPPGPPARTPSSTPSSGACSRGSPTPAPSRRRWRRSRPRPPDPRHPMPKLRWPRRKDWDPVALGHLILRDHLAAERPSPANERTLLASLRTALAMMAAGVTLLHFFDAVAADVSGFALLGLGIVALGFGTRRFFRVHRRVGTY